jgi:hypothetical protein
VLSISGGLWRLKGYPHGLSNVTMTFNAREPHVTITPYPEIGQVGHFGPDRVWITTENGQLQQERLQPRLKLAKTPPRTPWDLLDQLYFAGSGFWNYFTTPFLLTRPEVRSEEVASHEEHDEVWRRLKAQFPPSIPTHSEEQTFYFDEKGLLRRIDYVTVEGRIAAHYCYDHQSFDGLVSPTLRRVVPRTLERSKPSAPTIVLVSVASVTIS